MRWKPATGLRTETGTVKVLCPAVVMQMNSVPAFKVCAGMPIVKEGPHRVGQFSLKV